MNTSKSQTQRWLLPVILLVVGVAIGAGLGMAARPAEPQTTETPSIQQIYDASVQDAVFAEETEVEPLVCLTKDDPLVTWNDAGDRVLLLTWHKYPDSYPQGEMVTLDWGTVWTFTDRELAQYHTAEANAVTDWALRLKQLIGLPPDSAYTTMTGIWVRPQDVQRPAYQPDPAVGAMHTGFDDTVDEAFKGWFDDNIVWSYFDSAYPWTRMGYTYDWADNGTEYGLSEFLVAQGAEVEVAFTQTTDEFLAELAESGAAVQPALRTEGNGGDNNAKIFEEPTADRGVH